MASTIARVPRSQRGNSGERGAPWAIADLLSPTLPVTTLALAVAAQLLDLATFGLTVSRLGPSGEIGPLGTVYRMGGFGAVAAGKGLGILIMVALLEYYAWRIGGGRKLALLMAAVGIFGALTNVVALM